MNYKKARDIINHIEKKGSIYGLDTMEELLRRLDNPQQSLKFIHVAGTNGKGSVIAFLSEILSRGGYITGRFISPAVFSRRETISVNSKDIEEEEYALLFDKVLKAAKELERDGHRAPTAFEIDTAIAFLFFKMKQCQIVLLETGLGGKLDATNIIETPLCAVITSISRDHVNILGDTVEEIASHKAGIIKRGAFVVSAPQSPSVCRILEEAAKLAGTEIIYPLKCKIIEKTENLVNHSDFYQKFIYNGNEIYEVALRGAHQIENAAVAVEVLKVLRNCGFTVEDSAIKEGLKNTKWKGRFTIINRKPDIIMDGAHNAGAATALINAVSEYIEINNCRKIIMLAGMLSDKDYEEVIRTVAANCDKLITITTKVHNRQLQSGVLNEAALKYGISAVEADSVSDAVELAFDNLDREDLLLTFGSFSFLAEFEEMVKKHIEENGKNR